LAAGVSALIFLNLKAASLFRFERLPGWLPFLPFLQPTNQPTNQQTNQHNTGLIEVRAGGEGVSTVFAANTWREPLGGLSQVAGLASVWQHST
jgi:hypothetical protein